MHLKKFNKFLLSVLSISTLSVSFTTLSMEKKEKEKEKETIEEPIPQQDQNNKLKQLADLLIKQQRSIRETFN